MKIEYTLTVTVPDEIDEDIAAEIASEADERDTTGEAKVARWLGGFVGDSANVLSSWLPEGWYAKVADND